MPQPARQRNKPRLAAAGEPLGDDLDTYVQSRQGRYASANGETPSKAAGAPVCLTGKFLEDCVEGQSDADRRHRLIGTLGEQS